MPGNVFISYRREDTAGYAGRLYDRLKAAFPGRVFIDVGEIPPGADFAKAIEQHIEGCAALIALIGNNWTAQNRLRDPADFVRLEIAAALTRNISLIPVLVGGAKLPAAATLPEDIQPLLRRQTISINDEDWEGGCQRLLRALEMVLGPAGKKPKTALRWGVGLAAAVVVVLGLVLYWEKRSAPPSTSTAQTTPAAMPETTRSAAEYDKSVAKGYDNAAKVMGDVANRIGGTNQHPSPTITSISPSHARPFHFVTITGANFGAGKGGSIDCSPIFGPLADCIGFEPVGPHVPAAPNVSILSGSRDIKSWNETSITVRVPDLVPGAATVVVYAADVKSAPAHFTVDKP